MDHGLEILESRIRPRRFCGLLFGLYQISYVFPMTNVHTLLVEGYCYQNLEVLTRSSGDIGLSKTGTLDGNPCGHLSPTLF